MTGPMTWTPEGRFSALLKLGKSMVGFIEDRDIARMICLRYNALIGIDNPEEFVLSVLRRRAISDAMNDEEVPRE